MLTALEIENFKAFGDRQRIALRPITLLFGPNSGGKSSVTHALHYLRELLLHGNIDAHRTRSGGETLGLGGIRSPASNGGNADRVLVVWRKLTDDPEQDAAALGAWMDRHRESTRERTEHRDDHRIDVNGPVTLRQPTAEIRTVFPTEETFTLKMFEETNGVLE